MKKNKVVIIGSGFSGISAASYLAQKGYDVTILEKNDSAGGRARSFSCQGFTFDMGPSWYWMPDVFDKYFNDFDYKTSQLYTLERLDPSYSVIFGKDDMLELPASFSKLTELLEELEPGSSIKLNEFLEQAAYKYQVGMNQLVYKPSRSVQEFISLKLLYDILRMDVFKSFHKHIRQYFKDERILQIMEFPILLLGELPENTPALYSLMNYADIKLGTWYPQGGMFKIVEGMLKVAQELGVKVLLNQNVESFSFKVGKIDKVITQTDEFKADVVVASADYHHVEKNLLPQQYRTYQESYWESRKMAPSSLLFYVGINKKIKQLQHHNLFFDADFKPHAEDIYKKKQWPSKPLFYLSITSKTDPEVAPEGCENLFFLIPVAPGLEDTEEIREHYYHMVMDRLEEHIGENIKDSVIYKRSYAHNDFVKDYNAYKGNAYGLANTLMQTAILKPTIKSKKLCNLYFTGQLTVPGPGVPPSLISGKVVAEEVAKEYSLNN